MKKVHLTLVGGQPIPVYLGIQEDAEATNVILICSPESLEEAKRIEKQCPEHDVHIKQTSPVQLNEIQNLAKSLHEELINCEVTLNFTSGTKLWAFSFWQAFAKHPHAHFIYIDQNNVLTDLLTKQTRTCSISIQKRFELHGTPLTHYRKLKDYKPEDFEAIDDIEAARAYNRKHFHELTCVQYQANKERAEKGEQILFEGSSLTFYPASPQKAELCLYNYNKRSSRTFFLQSPHLKEILFNTGWFELKTAKAISQVPDIKEVWMNCLFKSGKGESKNEIDIIGETEHKLFFAECKTMIYDITDVDKFASALRNFSGISSKGILVTNDSPNAKSQRKYDLALEKCKDNGILALNFKQAQGKAQSLLNEIIRTNLTTQSKR